LGLGIRADRFSIGRCGRNNAPVPVKFGPTKMKGNALDFSFSGLKTAVLYHVRENGEYSEEIRKRKRRSLRRKKIRATSAALQPKTLV